MTRPRARDVVGIDINPNHLSPTLFTEVLGRTADAAANIQHALLRVTGEARKYPLYRLLLARMCIVIFANGREYQLACDGTHRVLARVVGHRGD